MAKQLRIPVTFRPSEEEIYNYVMTKSSRACYIKDLIKQDMLRAAAPVQYVQYMPFPGMVACDPPPVAASEPEPSVMADFELIDDDEFPD